jgi:hypothetical protein
MLEPVADIYVPAAVLHVARETDTEGECYRKGCDQLPIVAFTFNSATDEGGTESAYVYLCRLHMHGWLGQFLDNGESVRVEA